MNDELKGLVERLQNDINSMPWGDGGMSGVQLQQTVNYFVQAFVDSANAALEGEK